jgi:alpha-ketoglutaric semialdehyde dehydrogenase
MGVAAHQLISRNPARPDDEVLRLTPAGGIDLDRAVSRAQEASAAWGRTPAPQRGEALRLAADRIEQAAGELADLVCREVGKPIAEARGEVARSAAILRFNAGLTLDPEGDSMPPADG